MSNITEIKDLTPLAPRLEGETDGKIHADGEFSYGDQLSRPEGGRGIKPRLRARITVGFFKAVNFNTC